MPKPKHTDEQIQRASTRVEQRAETLDPDESEDIADLGAIGQAADPVRPDEAGPSEAVGVPRRNGRTWNQVAIPLVVSGHAARQPIADRTATGRR